MFTSILSSLEGGLSIQTALICSGTSVLLGFVVALIYMRQGTYTKNFVMTLILLPPLVQMVIMLVSGNLGAGVAVMGTFGLVRFRSVPGSSKDIASIFFAMAIGLATGMGYVTFAVMMTGVVGMVFLLLGKVSFGEPRYDEKNLKITIPENLDYTNVFDDIFEQYTKRYRLQKVKTTNLGSMYELEYHVTLREISKEKEMLDEIRCRNGNLTIVCGRGQSVIDEL